MNRFFAPSRRLAAHRREHGGPRIYDPRERALVGALDAVLRGVSRLAGWRPRGELLEPRSARSVLALRLDRVGDLVTTLPALAALRAALPEARIELAVGSWNEPIARRLPIIDRVRVVDVPWASRAPGASFRSARAALRGERFDLAVDFQGDLRVLLLMASTGATLRAGYGDTGGRYLLTHEGRWDERRSWYRQNMDLVGRLFPGVAVEGPIEPYNFVSEEDRREADRLLRTSGLDRAPRPLVGIHPSAGRSIKEWEPEKFAALADRLSSTAAVVLTGSESDRPLLERIAQAASSRPAVLSGVPLLTFAALVERFDVFVTGDTGPMHLAQSVGTPNVAIFGPSDPCRYGIESPRAPRRVVRVDLYCSPCNMIRRPPRECSREEAPECIARIQVEEVVGAVKSLARR